MKKKLFFTTVVFITISNIILNLCNDDKLADLTSLKMEAFANNGESSSGSLGPLLRYGCSITLKEIVGHASNGTPIIITSSYSGEMGNCAGSNGDCSPYPCTKLFGN